MKYFLIFHIAGGSLAVLSGYAALFAKKGGALHRRAGLLFVISMCAMGIGAAIVGLVRHLITWLGGPIVIYYSLTAMRTMQRRGPPERTDLVLTGFGIAIAVTSVTLTIRELVSPSGIPITIPLPVRLMSPTLMLLAVRGDLLERWHGALTGNRRLRRHIWRMCYAMFTATGSFFLGQAKVIPAALRIWPMLFVLALIPLAAMFYWLWRKRDRTAGNGTPVVGAQPLLDGN